MEAWVPYVRKMRKMCVHKANLSAQASALGNYDFEEEITTHGDKLTHTLIKV
jgi:hypothetical protein